MFGDSLRQGNIWNIFVIHCGRRTDGTMLGDSLMQGNLGNMRSYPMWYENSSYFLCDYLRNYCIRNDLSFWDIWVHHRFSGVCVAKKALVVCLVFVDHSWYFHQLSVSHCIPCLFSTYSFWLPLWGLRYFFEYGELWKILMISCDRGTFINLCIAF